MTVIERSQRLTTWFDVCAVKDLVLDRGVCALVGPYQVAVFRVSPAGRLFALSNYDPFSGAYVLSRGIVGSKGTTPTVASPVYKQRFDLRTGKSLEDESVAVMTFPVRANGGRVEVGLP